MESPPSFEVVATRVLGVAERILRSPAARTAYNNLFRYHGDPEPDEQKAEQESELKEPSKHITRAQVELKLYGILREIIGPPKDEETKEVLNKLSEEMLEAFERVMDTGTTKTGLPSDIMEKLQSIIGNASDIARHALQWQHGFDLQKDSPTGIVQQKRRLLMLRDCLSQVNDLLKGKDLGAVYDHTAGPYRPGTTHVTWPQLPRVKVKPAGTSADQLVPVGTVDIFPPEANEFTSPANGQWLNGHMFPQLLQFAHEARWEIKTTGGVPWIKKPDERENVLDVEVSDEGDVTIEELNNGAVAVQHDQSEVAPDAIDRGNAYVRIKKIRDIAVKNNEDVDDAWDEIDKLAVDAMNILKGS